MVFDNRLFFDDELIKFLKYKNSIISTETNYPTLNYTFFKRIQPKLAQETRPKLFSTDIKPQMQVPRAPFTTDTPGMVVGPGFGAYYYKDQTITATSDRKNNLRCGCLRLATCFHRLPAHKF